RSALAKSLGLGNQRRKTAPKAADHAETVSEKPKRAGRPRKAKGSAEA
ncbi:MucR family transcriptional regulator, partial [Methylobacterium sp. J-070]|nr:MucR family transcriptional regulator [Methylobacterium sp. J-070]MCJ2054799.1 MucR family transcriptional regulator [Methylobacterium sp. J-070]